VRRDRRLGEILEAGARALAARGVYGATMREVAREAGTSLANLYTYVGGREELIYRVHHRVLEVAVASAQATLGAHGARERLRALLTDHVRRVAQRPAEAEILRGAATPLKGDRARRVEDLRRRYLTLVRAAGDAVLGTASARESEVRARLLLGMADRVALDAAAGRAAPKPERLALPILRLFLAGSGRRARRS